MFLRIIALCLLLTACSSQSPTGRGQLLMFSPEQMRQMGGQSFEEIKKKETISKDAKLNSYVQCITNAVTAPDILMQVDPTQQETWNVVLFESEQVNAFALPGGHIGVYTGLLKVADTPDELASVIGHEVAHVMANHGNEQVSRGQLAGIGMEITNVALGTSGTAHRETIMAGLGLGLQVGILLPFSREQEVEADVLGLELMSRAGFNPAASIHLWQDMAAASNGAPPEMLSTHPGHSTRIQGLSKLQPRALQWYQQARAQGRIPQCRAPKV